MELDQPQVELAVRALLRHLKQADKNQLFNDENHVLLQITFKKVPKECRSPKRIPLPHSVFDGPNCELCLITKDPQKEFEELVASKNIPGRIKVLGVSKLRSDFKPYESKRQLCASYDMFLCDDRVAPVLPRLLGKKFYETKKKPININMKRGDLAAEIAKARDAAHLYLGPGACSSLKIGHTNFSAEQLVENIMSAAALSATFVAEGNIQNIQIKTSTSVSLPIYSSLPTLKDFEADPKHDIKPFYPKKEKNKDKGKRRREGSAKGAAKAVSADADAAAPKKAATKLKKRKSDAVDAGGASDQEKAPKKVKKASTAAKKAPAKVVKKVKAAPKAAAAKAPTATKKKKKSKAKASS